MATKAVQCGQGALGGDIEYRAGAGGRGPALAGDAVELSICALNEGRRKGVTAVGAASEIEQDGDGGRLRGKKGRASEEKRSRRDASRPIGEKRALLHDLLPFYVEGPEERLRICFLVLAGLEKPTETAAFRRRDGAKSWPVFPMEDPVAWGRGAVPILERLLDRCPSGFRGGWFGARTVDGGVRGIPGRSAATDLGAMAPILVLSGVGRVWVCAVPP